MVLNRIALLGVLLAVAGAGACTTVRGVQPAEYLAMNSPEVVWVTYANNTLVPLAEPEIRRDTLRGMLQGQRERVKIPLADVRSVQARTPDHTKTAILATTLGVAAATSVYFLLVSQGGGSGSGESVSCGVDVKGRALQYC